MPLEIDTPKKLHDELTAINMNDSRRDYEMFILDLKQKKQAMYFGGPEFTQEILQEEEKSIEESLNRFFEKLYFEDETSFVTMGQTEIEKKAVIELLKLT